MLFTLLLLLIAIAILVKSSDFFVDYASRIASRIGISQFVIGLTLVALGTSLPELVSSLFAAFQNKPDFILGNILGSNVANIGLILGTGALLMHFKTNKTMLIRDGSVLFGGSILFTIFLLTENSISQGEGIILLVLFIGYTLFLLDLRFKKDIVKAGKLLSSFHTFKTIFYSIYHKTKKHVKQLRENYKESVIFDFFIVFLSAVGIYFGARFTVKYAIELATTIGISEGVIGFSIVAIGTSLPELSVTLSSARKGLSDILIGNVIGSNIANMFLVGGASAIVAPLIISNFTILFAMISITILLLIFIRSRWKMDRLEGILLLSFYIIFLAWVLFKDIT